MGRKNQRADIAHEPLDGASVLAEIEATPVRVVRRRETDEERDERIRQSFERRRRRNDRRTDTRVADALKGHWDVCCIPGCTTEPRNWFGPRVSGHRRPDVSVELPICERHMVIIRSQAISIWENPDMVAARQHYARRWVEHEVAEQRRSNTIEENDGAEQGQIYFVRLNGMIKVGWSSKLRSRLKSYGASAEILCHYPASRPEERDLHRQLRPYLAMGREWYQECQLLEDVVAGVIQRHGEPTIFPAWTRPKADLAAKPRSWPAA